MSVIPAIYEEKQEDEIIQHHAQLHSYFRARMGYYESFSKESKQTKNQTFNLEYIES